ncbi:Putative thiol oxidoreductase [Sandaracinus amylolyticus]|uniref:Putative thiol oxidoreductase n=1 Tax=Sandaracinus amylolyticus TaxID=927083 RepID=A0A0F6W9C0_9BACT|nr:Putative thiol oxidoreductase [Sandaracinus amylolyticus]
MGIALAAACGDEPPALPEIAAAPIERVVEDPSDAPLAGLSEEELVRFEDGDARFELPFREAQGLGPLYIHRACTSCHEDDARGPGAVRRIVRRGADAPALPWGDVVRPRMTAGASVPVMAPAHPAIGEAVRLAPAVFARGLIEAIPDAAIEANARRGTGGRVARLRDGRIGRFGHKARTATLDEFVADALLGDMGLTSPVRPEELPGPEGIRDDAKPGVDVSDEEIALLADYVRLLAMPRREARDGTVFEEIGCATCHLPSMRTRDDHPVRALRDVDAAIYSDLLLHDMGDGLADGIEEGAASGREWRTAPLVGVRHLRGLMHDGRARTVREAIDAHASEGSEANEVVARWRALGEDEQRALITFVEAL